MSEPVPKLSPKIHCSRFRCMVQLRFHASFHSSSFPAQINADGGTGQIMDFSLAAAAAAAVYSGSRDRRLGKTDLKVLPSLSVQIFL